MLTLVDRVPPRRRLIALFSLLAGTLATLAGSAPAQVAYPVPGATPQAAQLISNFEGFRADPYNDAQHGGNCTVGYGTLLHRGACTAADTAAYPNGISRQDAQNLLQNDANAAANTIDHNVTVPLTQQQRDALTSFVYNVGQTAFTNSTLLRDINSGNSQAAADQLLRWVNQNGHFVQGLQNRRDAERCYFLNGTATCQGPLRDARRLLARGAGAVSATAAAAAHGRPQLKLLSHHPRAGTTLRYGGSGWARGRVKVYAFVPGISPYRGINLRTRAGRQGRFTAGWRVSRRIVDTFRWKLSATQGHRTATLKVRIKAA